MQIYIACWKRMTSQNSTTLFTLSASILMGFFYQKKQIQIKFVYLNEIKHKTRTVPRWLYTRFQFSRFQTFELRFSNSDVHFLTHSISVFQIVIARFSISQFPFTFFFNCWVGLFKFRFTYDWHFQITCPIFLFRCSMSNVTERVAITNGQHASGNWYGAWLAPYFALIAC